jgi:hypothetical protein
VWLLKLEHEFEREVLDKLKRKRRSNKDEEEIHHESSEIVEKMKRAYLDDLQEINAKRPAIHKLHLLPEALEQLSKYSALVITYSYPSPFSQAR